MGVFLQSPVQAPKVHETSWMVYTALIIQNAIWFHFKMLNFTKKLFFLHTRYIIFEGGVGGQKNLEKKLFCFFLDFCPKRNTNSPGEGNFSEKGFFWATLTYVSGKCNDNIKADRQPHLSAPVLFS